MHTGDFKVDYTPVFGDAIDLQRFAEIGKKGCTGTDVQTVPMQSVLALHSLRGQWELHLISLFAEHYRYTRIIVATFASNVDRVQQIINTCLQVWT